MLKNENKKCLGEAIFIYHVTIISPTIRRHYKSEMHYACTHFCCFKHFHLKYQWVSKMFSWQWHIKQHLDFIICSRRLASSSEVLMVCRIMGRSSKPLFTTGQALTHHTSHLCKQKEGKKLFCNIYLEVDSYFGVYFYNYDKDNKIWSYLIKVINVEIVWD